MRAIDEGYLDVARNLIDHGADVNYSDDLGDTALGTAVFSGSIEMVALLVAKGSKVNFKDRSGYTARHYAEREKSLS
jgi:ankyrin repeat protein